MTGVGGPDPRHRAAARLFPVLLSLLGTAPSAEAAPLFMWEAAGPHATVTMIGSVHVGQPDFFPLPAPYEAAFAAAQVLAVEVDMLSPTNQARLTALVAERGSLPDSVTLRDRLTPATWSRLAIAAGEHGLPIAAIERREAGLVAMILEVRAYLRQGFDPELGIDRHFLDAAREQGKPVRELESVDRQLNLFLDLDEDLGEVLIAQLLDELGDLAALTGRMVEAWQRGDAAALDSMLQEQSGDDPRLTGWYRRLLDDRNAAMADSLDHWLRGNVDVCVVVGAGHFVGERGLVRLLGDRGWTVTQRQD
jgi:uncharacterized protein YbaP (TraB family)